jgi:hypothetical protein
MVCTRTARLVITQYLSGGIVVPTVAHPERNAATRAPATGTHLRGVKRLNEITGLAAANTLDINGEIGTVFGTQRRREAGNKYDSQGNQKNRFHQ